MGVLRVGPRPGVGRARRPAHQPGGGWTYATLIRERAGPTTLGAWPPAARAQGMAAKVLPDRLKAGMHGRTARPES